MGLYGGQGLNLSLRGIGTNRINLKAGQVYTPPPGWWGVRADGYSTIQQRDPISGLWWAIGNGGTGAGFDYFQFDGQNYRIANQTGCAVGAAITNVGSGYTTAPVVTASAGNSIWQAIIGGAVGQTVTVTNGGANYSYAPLVQFSAPPAGGVQATGYCTLSGGAVSTVTVVDQGAGYASPPTISFFNDPREGLNGVTVGYNAAAVSTLTGSGTITAILCLDHGNAIAYTAGSATSIPTLTIAPQLGSAAATAIMNWSVVGLQSGSYTNGTSGIEATQALAIGVDQPPTPNSTVLNTAVQAKLVKTRQCLLSSTPGSNVLPAYTAWTVNDGGIYTGTPLLSILFNQYSTAPGAMVGALAVMGGIDSEIYLQQC